MGEIKSTLDIVMEKTKHLSLSEEEKNEQRMEDLRKAVKGLVQKFMDQVINIEQVAGTWNGLEKEDRLSDRKILVDEIMARIQLNQDNSLLMTLLRDICGQDVDSLESVLADYTRQKYEIIETRRKRIQKEIADRHGISGSAVVPNLDTDSGWADAMKAFENRFQEKLDTKKANYK